VTVYDKEPFNGGKAIFSGSVAKSFPMIAKISIPTAYTQLFFQLSSTSGFGQIITANVSDNIQVTFTEPGGGSRLKGTDVVEPDCNTGCDVTISGIHATKLTINDGQTYCVTTSYSGEIEVEEGTLKICGTYSGTGNDGKITVGKNGKTTELIITSTAQANISTLELKYQATATVYSNATATIGLAVVNLPLLSGKKKRIHACIDRTGSGAPPCLHHYRQLQSCGRNLPDAGISVPDNLSKL
jgi:hypothetical protein